MIMITMTVMAILWCYMGRIGAFDDAFSKSSYLNYHLSDFVKVLFPCGFNFLEMVDGFTVFVRLFLMVSEMIYVCRGFLYVWCRARYSRVP